MNIFAAAQPHDRSTAARPHDAFAAARRHMVDGQVRTADVTDLRILAAMSEIPRERFLPQALAGLAYLDLDVPVSATRRLLKPIVFAKLVQALDLSGEERVLDVGAVGGYGAAVLARLAGHVVALEEDASLAASTQAALADAPNVTAAGGPLAAGWPQGAPYDAIVVAAAGPRVPDALRRQLAVGGRLVMPVGDEHGAQRLVRVVRDDADRFRETDLGGVMFVPLVGEQGWRADSNGA